MALLVLALVVVAVAALLVRPRVDSLGTLVHRSEPVFNLEYDTGALRSVAPGAGELARLEGRQRAAVGHDHRAAAGAAGLRGRRRPRPAPGLRVRPHPDARRRARPLPADRPAPHADQRRAGLRGQVHQRPGGATDARHRHAAAPRRGAVTRGGAPQHAADGRRRAEAERAREGVRGQRERGVPVLRLRDRAPLNAGGRRPVPGTGRSRVSPVMLSPSLRFFRPWNPDSVSGVRVSYPPDRSLLLSGWIFRCPGRRPRGRTPPRRPGTATGSSRT